MPDQPTEVLCPTCNRLLLGLSPDFTGDVSTKCPKCVSDVGYPLLATVPHVRLNCQCGKWLAMGAVRTGMVRARCGRCRVLVGFTVTGSQHLEPPRLRKRALPSPPRPPRPYVQPTDIVALIEERWGLLRAERVHRSVELAVGIRFDVFNRDGFRCRYCGRGPEQGVFLEADHVVPRSAGGPDTLANLVTACWDCNHGKAAKPVAH